MAEIHESLRDIKSIVEKYDDLFDDVVFISSINVPIVRLRHRATNIKVDLSQNTKMSVHNTLLLKAYTAIDPRVSVYKLSCGFLSETFSNSNIFCVVDSWLLSESND